MNTPIAFIVYKRLDATKRVFETIRQARPPRLYLIADGPKTPDLKDACLQTRELVEKGIDWPCELHRVYSSTNLGCAVRVQTGLDHVFAKEESAIILEDDTLPNDSFFRFCEELLLRYSNDNRVAHISGCNQHPEAFPKGTECSYCFSFICEIWGWATWRRAWKKYDLKMQKWSMLRNTDLVESRVFSRKARKGTRKMFDLHCDNPDPWTWDYQWSFCCWSQNGFSVMPRVNLVTNLGIGNQATHTVSQVKVEQYPKIRKELENIVHPEKVEPNRDHDALYELRNLKLFSSGIIPKIIRKTHRLFSFCFKNTKQTQQTANSIGS